LKGLGGSGTDLLIRVVLGEIAKDGRRLRVANLAEGADYPPATTGIGGPKAGLEEQDRPVTARHQANFSDVSTPRCFTRQNLDFALDGSVIAASTSRDDEQENKLWYESRHVFVGLRTGSPAELG